MSLGIRQPSLTLVIRCGLGRLSCAAAPPHPAAPSSTGVESLQPEQMSQALCMRCCGGLCVGGFWGLGVRGLGMLFSQELDMDVSEFWKRLVGFR